MGVVSDLIDGVVEVSTGSAEIVASKWSVIVGGGLGLIALLVLVILLVTVPMAGIVLAIVLLGVLYILSQGDNDVI